MKQLKLAVMALFTLVIVSNVNAQDENNPWVAGVGVNIIDINDKSGFGKQFEDLIGPGDFNFLFPAVTVDRYLSDGFSLQLAMAFGKIKKHPNADIVDSDFFSIDVSAKYNVLKDAKLFDPFLQVGGGYTSINSEGEGMGFGALGTNLWFNEVLGARLQTGVKFGFSDKLDAMFNSSVAVVYRFGGKDSDGDGVYDRQDACPMVAGLKSFKGCPDADGDGIKDSDDKCPNTAGLITMNGCPDSDGDGIADKDDMCPNSRGTKSNKGCPDTDGDGVIDKNDKCASIAGPIENAGCPWPDTDGDGILDKDDKCPSIAGVPSERGCPEKIITKKATEVIAFSAKSILFNPGRTSFKRGVTAKLNAIVSIMNKFPKAKFSIEGHTDSSGRASSNLKLSSRRASAVKNYFIKKGISSKRLQSKGFGERFPIVSNKTRAGRTKNRRVEVKVTNNN